MYWGEKRESVEEEKLMLQKWGNNCRSKVLKTKKGIESVFKMEKLDWEDRV